MIESSVGEFITLVFGAVYAPIAGAVIAILMTLLIYLYIRDRFLEQPKGD